MIPASPTLPARQANTHHSREAADHAFDDAEPADAGTAANQRRILSAARLGNWIEPVRNAVVVEVGIATVAEAVTVIVQLVGVGGGRAVVGWDQLSGRLIEQVEDAVAGDRAGVGAGDAVGAVEGVTFVGTAGTGIKRTRRDAAVEAADVVAVADAAVIAEVDPERLLDGGFVVAL